MGPIETGHLLVRLGEALPQAEVDESDAQPEDSE
jgi:hypothetical protein